MKWHDWPSLYSFLQQQIPGTWERKWPGTKKGYTEGHPSTKGATIRVGSVREPTKGTRAKQFKAGTWAL